MSNYNDTNGNLAKDYIRGAHNFLYAAEKICTQVEKNSTEWLFTLEDPVTFLVGHGAELILKAGLAKLGILDNRKLKNSHALLELANKSREQHIPVEDNFYFWVQTINDNFNAHDHRYSRTFSGFPDSEHNRLSASINNPSPQAQKELKDYGLVVKSPPDLQKFLTASQKQLNITIAWLDNHTTPTHALPRPTTAES